MEKRNLSDTEDKGENTKNDMVITSVHFLQKSDSEMKMKKALAMLFGKETIVENSNGAESRSFTYKARNNRICELNKKAN